MRDKTTIELEALYESLKFDSDDDFIIEAGEFIVEAFSDREKYTLERVLDNFLGYPKIIHTKTGKDRIVTSRNMILKGQVRINGFTVTNPEEPVKPGTHIKWGVYKRSMSVP